MTKNQKLKQELGLINPDSYLATFVAKCDLKDFDSALYERSQKFERILKEESKDSPYAEEDDI